MSSSSFSFDTKSRISVRRLQLNIKRDKDKILNELKQNNITPLKEDKKQEILPPYIRITKSSSA